jgi:hypothetical protein
VGSLAGRNLTFVVVLLIAAAAAAGGRIVLRGEMRPAGRAAGTSAEGERRAAESIALARAAERRGDVPEALSLYRKAASLDPRCLDRRSSLYLGPAFEESLKRWISGLRARRIAGDSAALDDASFLFRRMYGGCG